jgi:hypothetical protein
MDIQVPDTSKVLKCFLFSFFFDYTLNLKAAVLWETSNLYRKLIFKVC